LTELTYFRIKNPIAKIRESQHLEGINYEKCTIGATIFLRMEIGDSLGHFQWSNIK
jgi:hypothetical protein